MLAEEIILGGAVFVFLLKPDGLGITETTGGAPGRGNMEMLILKLFAYEHFKFKL